MDRLFDVVAIFSLVLIVWVLSSVRRAHIRVEYSVSSAARGRHASDPRTLENAG